MGLVIEGPALAVVQSGARHRLETGDVYHAQPGVVQGLAGAGVRPARLMHVVDTRRTAERVADQGDSKK
jgi:quercetin dioxygenase-like cupin family protein